MAVGKIQSNLDIQVITCMIILSNFWHHLFKENSTYPHKTWHAMKLRHSPSTWRSSTFIWLSPQNCIKRKLSKNENKKRSCLMVFMRYSTTSVHCFWPVCCLSHEKENKLLYIVSVSFKPNQQFIFFIFSIFRWRSPKLCFLFWKA